MLYIIHLLHSHRNKIKRSPFTDRSTSDAVPVSHRCSVRGTISTGPATRAAMQRIHHTSTWGPKWRGGPPKFGGKRGATILRWSNFRWVSFFFTKLCKIGIIKCPFNTCFTLLYLKGDTREDPPSQNVELSIEDPSPGEVHAEIQPVTFQLVDSGTKRRKTSLIDSLGFCYNVHSKWPYATYWQCTVRPKGNPCKVSVTEREGGFPAGQALSQPYSGGGSSSRGQDSSQSKE